MSVYHSFCDVKMMKNEQFDVFANGSLILRCEKNKAGIFDTFISKVTMIYMNKIFDI